MDYRCLLEIRILLSPSCKQTGFREWLRKSVPLQIIALSYGPKCIILLIVDTVSDYLSDGSYKAIQYFLELV